MTIIEFLDDPHCIFCEQKLTIRPDANDTFLCVQHQASVTSRWANAVWQFRGAYINAVNIIIDRFQVCWDKNDGKTSIIDQLNGKSIAEFNCLLDLPLEPERLLAKIKTIAVFS